MPLRRSLSAFAALALGALALAGCATPAPEGASAKAPIANAGEQMEVDAAWLAGGSLIALVTQGSSSCVPVATDASVQADGTLAVVLEDPKADAGAELVCTADLAPRATLVGVPEGVDPTQELTITLTYGTDAWGATELEGFTGAAAEEYSPSAVVVADDLIAVLTWGSSSCKPLVESAEVDGQTLAVTFAAPAADRMCTMDMAPRVTLVGAPAAGQAETVTLTGGPEFAEPVVVPLG